MEPPAKRPRGRPRKNPTSAAPAVKRPRGRPRKYPASAADNAAAVTNPAVLKTAPYKRTKAKRRPPPTAIEKRRKAETEAQQALHHQSPAAAAASQQSQNGKRKRGPVEEEIRLQINQRQAAAPAATEPMPKTRETAAALQQKDQQRSQTQEEARQKLEQAQEAAARMKPEDAVAARRRRREEAATAAAEAEVKQPSVYHRPQVKEKLYKVYDLKTGAKVIETFLDDERLQGPSQAFAKEQMQNLVQKLRGEAQETLDQYPDSKLSPWEKHYKNLVLFKLENGHCRVGFQNPDLKHFIDQQRERYRRRDKNRNKERVKSDLEYLDKLDVRWREPVFTVRSWEENYKLLVAYKEEHGNVRVPQIYKPDRVLGSWVAGQRRHYDWLQDGKKAPLTPEQIQKLNDLGFVWKMRHGRPKGFKAAERAKAKQEAMAAKAAQEKAEEEARLQKEAEERAAQESARLQQEEEAEMQAREQVRLQREAAVVGRETAQMMERTQAAQYEAAAHLHNAFAGHDRSIPFSSHHQMDPSYDYSPFAFRR